MTEHNNILLYGASNLWISRRAALSQVRRRFPGALQIGLANGPGRSYGLRAGNPLVRYEALRDVRFDFNQVQPRHRLAVITDIGNDIAYAQPPKQVLRWVCDLTAELESQNYRIIVGGIPCQSLERINPQLFKAIAKLYYPQGSVDKQYLLNQLYALEEGLSALCAERGYYHPPVDSDWYSIDRFHLKLSSTHAYWNSLLQEYPPLPGTPTPSLWHSMKLLFPRRYWMGGKERLGKSVYRTLLPQAHVWVR